MRVYPYGVCIVFNHAGSVTERGELCGAGRNMIIVCPYCGKLGHKTPMKPSLLVYDKYFRKVCPLVKKAAERFFHLHYPVLKN